MAKLKATFHVKKDIDYDELEITTSADGVTYGGGTSGLSATDVQSAIDEVVTETNVTLNTKQATITGGATTIATSNLTVNKALISDASGKVGTSATSNTELGYLSGVTSAVQAQLNAKQGKVANVDDTEIGFLNGVTSSIQTQINDKIKSTVYSFGTISVGGTKTINLDTINISIDANKLINIVVVDENTTCWYNNKNIDISVTNLAPIFPINITNNTASNIFATVIFYYYS